MKFFFILQHLQKLRELSKICATIDLVLNHIHFLKVANGRNSRT
jgi:hypothetical protein